MTRRPPSKPPVRRLGDTLRALLALTALLGLTAGPPLLLARLAGWPLPRRLPALETLPGILTGPIPDEAIANGLVTLAWLWWAHFLACLVVEAAATLRGRPPRRVPAGALSQALAARLLSAVLLLGPSPSFIQPAAAAAAPRAAVIATAALQPTPTSIALEAAIRYPATPHAADIADPQDHDQPASRHYTVPARQPGQPSPTLWGIAEAHLRDPFRWREIWELNKGQPLPDPPGGTFSDPDLIYPGQHLLLPPDATGLSPTPQKPPDRQPVPSTVREPPPPITPAEPTSTSSPSSSTAGSPTTRPQPTPGAPGEAPTVQDGMGRLAAVVAAMAGTGLLAAGVIAIVTRRRRIQQRARRFGRRIKLPTGSTLETEHALRATQQPDDAHWLDLALRALAERARHDSLQLPQVQAVLLGPDALEIHFTTHVVDPPPPPFVAGATADRWRLDRTISIDDLARLANGAVAPLPTLVTLGHTEHAKVMVNLEAAGLVGIAGPPKDAKAILDAMAVELATSTWGGYFDLVLVGFGHDLETLERVRHAPTFKDVLPDLEQRWQRARDLLRDTGAPSTWAARLATPTPDSWTPTVILSAVPPSPETLQRLAAAANDPAGLPFAAVLPGDDPQVPWRIDLAGEHARVPPLKLHLRPQQLSEQAASAVGDLLATSTDTRDVDPADPPYDTVQPIPLPPVRSPTSALVVEHEQMSPEEEELVPAGPVEVRILGPVEVHGPRVNRTKSVELLAYLALHPRGVDGEQIWEALWPGRPLVHATLHTTVSVARNRLGNAPDNTPYVCDVRDGTYRLHPALSLDWGRFQALVAHADKHPEQATTALRQALELIRGTPLRPKTQRGYEWAIIHRTEIESAVGDGAEHLAQLHLAAGDHTSSTWAARRGLLANPYDERLYRQLMLAADHAGNPPGVDAILEELLHVLDADTEPLDVLHPETIALYKRLRGKRSLLG